MFNGDVSKAGYVILIILLFVLGTVAAGLITYLLVRRSTKKHSKDTEAIDIDEH